MTRVLFVCPHNADRSPAAQVFYEQRGGEARSAGPEPAPELLPVVVDALAEVGIDLEGRRPARLSADDVEWADVVVTMDAACPVLPGRTYLEWPIADPVGLCLEEARELCSAIEQRVAALPL